jgi:drug/metabolite transporter (DMT)-like permease
MATRYHSHIWPGVPLALASAALFGAVTPISSLLLKSADSFLVAGLLYLGAGIGMGVTAWHATGKAERSEAGLSRKDLPWLALAVTAGGIVAPVLLMLGISRSSASTSSLLLNLEGLATMVIAWIVYRENADRRLLLGALAILAGAVVLTAKGWSPDLNLGSLFIAGACLCWGLDNNFTRKISAADPAVITSIKGLAGGAANLSIAALNGASLPSPGFAFAAMILGFLGIGVSLVMFILAMRYLGTARTGAYYSLAPFIGATLSLALLGEPVTANMLIAALLMATGLWLHLTEDHAHDHVHNELEHDHAHIHDAHHQHDHEGLVTEPHSHWHRHKPLRHKHPHFPDLHHHHSHQ